MLFKNISFSLIIFLIFSATVFCQRNNNPEITSEEIKEHICFLASDELKGRDSGTEEIKKAADY
ncbi:MAG: peptidase M28, partial [Ignavibacteriaceae bacterium]|nr:peptidase M28 [Ignavibacteriaceae bacterium]